jgi:isocitrate dehydrogenase
MNYIMPQFLHKKTSDGFLIMFRNNTGDVYLLTEISQELHNNFTVELPRSGIQPRYKVSIDDNGDLVVNAYVDSNSRENTNVYQIHTIYDLISRYPLANLRGFLPVKT